MYKAFDDKTYTVDVKASDTIATVKAKIQDKLGEIEDMRLEFAGKQLEDSAVIGSYKVTKASTLQVLGRLRAGGWLTKKKHLKRDEAAVHLKEVVRGFVKKSEPLPADVVFEENFAKFLEGFDAKLDALKFLKASGTKVIVNGLRQLSDADLASLTDILKAKAGRAATQEHKMLKAIEVVYPLMQQMSNYTAAISAKQSTFAEELLTILADEYMSYDSGAGEVKVDMVALTADISKEVERRIVLQSIGHQEQPRDNGIGCTVS